MIFSQPGLTFHVSIWMENNTTSVSFLSFTTALQVTFYFVYTLTLFPLPFYMPVFSSFIFSVSPSLQCIPCKLGDMKNQNIEIYLPGVKGDNASEMYYCCLSLCELEAAPGFGPSLEEDLVRLNGSSSGP